MIPLVSLGAGLLFGIGLIVGGMADPSKVLAFLDLGGAWDPSLALVMGGGVAIGLAGFTVAKRRTTSLLGQPMRLPNARTVDRRLILGSVAFGIGWGLAGICPGPALVLIGTGSAKAGLFGAAMLAGMTLFAGMTRPAASASDARKPGCARASAKPV
jgi:uncharacterized membrane protein YedE/YeeE